MNYVNINKLPFCAKSQSSTMYLMYGIVPLSDTVAPPVSENTSSPPVH